MSDTIPFIPEMTIAIECSDLDRSLEWYQSHLGFELLYKLDEMGWAELKTSVPGVNLGVSQVENAKIAGPTPTFGVSDIDSARAMLESKGVKFDGETMTIPDMVRLATFFDPDGNAIMFFETLGEM